MGECIVEHEFDPSMRAQTAFGQLFFRVQALENRRAAIARAQLRQCPRSSAKWKPSFRTIPIGIVGASYGGYAALAGVTFNPELHRCAVSIAGISDLSEHSEQFKRKLGRARAFAIADLRALVGVPITMRLCSRQRLPLGTWSAW